MKYSNLPVKFAPVYVRIPIKLAKNFQKIKIQLLQNVLMFTANQTRHKNVQDLNKS